MNFIKGLFKAFWKAVAVAWLIDIPFIIAFYGFGWISEKTYTYIWEIIISITLFIFIGQFIIIYSKDKKKLTAKKR